MIRMIKFKSFLHNQKKINNYFIYQDEKPFLSEEVLNTLLETEKYIIKMKEKNKSFSNFSFFEKLKKYILLKHTINNLTGLYNLTFFKLPKSTKYFIDLANQTCSGKCKLIFTYIPASEYWSKEPLQQI